MEKLVGTVTSCADPQVAAKLGRAPITTPANPETEVDITTDGQFHDGMPSALPHEEQH
jgi:hypothetical protein